MQYYSSLFFVWFNFSSHSLEDEGNFTIKIVEIFELHARMRSAEYQTTVPLKVPIVIHNYANALDNQPIKITTRFSASDVTGRH